ncbi:MAG: DUF6362 family protein [Anderseniella sp.]
MIWTSDIVIYRLIRAADTIRRLPGGGLRPAGFTSAWPIVRDEWADQLARVGSEETRDRNRARLSPPRPGEIDRMYQCMDWMSHVSEPPYRKALLIYCRDKAHGRRFSRSCKTLGWNRRTAYNRKDKAAQQVASTLHKNAVPLLQADIDAVAQMAAKHMHNNAKTGNRARPPKSWIAEGTKPEMFVPEPAE